MSSTSREELKNRAESFVELVEDFDKTLNALYEFYFRYLVVIVTCIFCDGFDKEAVKILITKFFKYDKKFKNFCKSKRYFRTLKKIVVTSKEENIKKFEFLVNYQENETFLDRNEMRKLVEYFESFDHKVKDIVTFDYDNKNHLMIKAEDLKDLINASNFNRDEVKEKLNGLTVLSRKTEIEFLSSLFDGILFVKKLNKFKFKYYKDYIMSKQETILYKEKSNKNEECAVCLEEFINGDCVTKLRCGHVFCTSCIEKWLVKSRTCPIDRQNPRFVSNK